MRWRDGGKNRGRQFDRLRDANAWDAEVKRRRRLGELDMLEMGRQTLEELYADWHELHVKTLTPSTIESYEGLWRTRIEPKLGKLRLTQVTPEVVERFARELVESGVGVASVRRALVVLQGMLSFAVRFGRVPRNAASIARKPKAGPSKRARPLSPTQVEGIRSRLDGRDAVLVSVLAHLGLRPGESLGLRWSDIGEMCVTVDRAVSCGEIKSTKTGHSRVVRMLAPLAQDLCEYRLVQGRPGDDALVFPAHGGGVWTREDWRNWRKRIFRPAAVAAGLPASTRPYDLRHTHASMLIKSGMNIVEAAAELGHSPSMLLSTYAHVMSEFAGQGLVDYEAEVRTARAASAQGLTGAVAPASQ